jgi:hypothetical protein
MFPTRQFFATIVLFFYHVSGEVSGKDSGEFCAFGG